MKLVLAGSHPQYVAWLGRGRGNEVRSPADYRAVRSPEQLRGIHARDVDDLIQLGSYWENPAWGSETYKALMAYGVELDQHWAMPWEVDWARAESLRSHKPPTAAELAAVAADQAAIEKLLGE